MRRMIRTTGIAVAGFVAALGVASATDRDEQAPEGRAYLGFSFGGAKTAPRDFHYGLRIDHDARFVEGQTSPLMQFDFTPRGFADARVNGLSVLSQQYRLRQSEEQAAEEAGGEPAPAEPAPADEAAPADAAPAEGAEPAAEGGEEAAAAEEGGFFSNMWGGVTGFFGGLFGGDDDEATAEAPAEAPAETAEAGAEAPAEEVGEGAFASYDIVDWGLLAAGIAGVGLAASEVSGADETPDRAGFGGGTGGTGGTSGTTTGGGCSTTVGPAGVCITTMTYAPNRWTSPYDVDRHDPEYAKWLDGGTGQMGDLGGR